MTADTTTTAEAAIGLQAVYSERFALNVPEQFIEAVRACQAITAAHTAVNSAADSDAAVTALPDEFTLHDLERFQRTRRRQRGTFSTNFIQPFAAYTIANQEHGTTVFVNALLMAATAVLDLGSSRDPGHADNTAELQLKATAAFDALMLFQGRSHRQGAVAEFFEDWANHAQLAFFDETGALSGKQAIAAIRSLTIEHARKVDSDEQQLGANLTAFESVKASSKNTLPTTIYFTTRPYPELQPRQFVMRLGVNTGESTPSITLRIQNTGQHVEEMGAELSSLIANAMGSVLPVLMGSYQKGK